MLKSKNRCRDYPSVMLLLETRIFARRKEMELSQEDLADRAGLTRNCIQQIECHEHLPQMTTLAGVMAALGFSEKERDDFMKEYQEAYYRDWKDQKERPPALAMR